MDDKANLFARCGKNTKNIYTLQKKKLKWRECKTKRLSWVAYNVYKMKQRRGFGTKTLGCLLEVFGAKKMQKSSSNLQKPAKNNKIILLEIAKITWNILFYITINKNN
jgi:hypothetical protein